jgi:hypothetical protein
MKARNEGEFIFQKGNPVSKLRTHLDPIYSVTYALLSMETELDKSSPVLDGSEVELSVHLTLTNTLLLTCPVWIYKADVYPCNAVKIT